MDRGCNGKNSNGIALGSFFVPLCLCPGLLIARDEQITNRNTNLARLTEPEPGKGADEPWFLFTGLRCRSRNSHMI
ncbi:hypothetical protein BO70DRAFT_358502 [Aspergillus heteromorphus CBS 117.55]|uniref:Uncharacterized protein n=1 Tax=Aspergillus heteromorphus CBS 117.55 TaxID=1448321 RepID=A0A317WXF2_9EURO|nr:uncharacterized protein BO70DRAFT_358502 [Aspergillus heteromorphus CBS 117.55]PWY91069.1 hypothetical protein BO70DRAFT_358502 [Aspergillus heteromorphus CBS 117.55]